MTLKQSLILAAFSLLLYSNSLFNGFMSDDYDLMDDARLTPGAAGQLLSPSYWTGIPEDGRGRFRPVRTASLLADRALYGRSPAGYHLTNALINAAAVVSAGYFGAMAFGCAEAGFYGGLVFAAYPVHSESVDWIKNRSDMLCAVFYFLSLIFLLRYSSGGAGAAGAAALLFCVLSFLSKETGGTLPLAAAAAAFLLRGGVERRRGLKLAAALLAITAAWFLLKEFWWRKELLAQAAGVDAYLQLRLVLYTLGKYLSLLFFPFALSAEQSFDVMSGMPVSSWLALAAFAALGAWAWLKRDREMAFSLAWVLILLLPVLNLVLLASRPIAEQRLYLPAAGFAWLCALVFSRFKAARYALPIGCALLFAFSTATFARNFVWKDDLTFWKAAVRSNPANYRANYNLGAEYQRRGRFEEAIKHYKTASLDADLPEIYYGLAFCYDRTGDYLRAMQNYLMTEKLARRPSPDLYNNMGIVCEKAGDKRGAEAYYRRAIAVDPAYTPALKNLEALWKKK